ncbi:MAG: hypothetical protein SWY16_02000 [Cyanobacteriota bacterium]|nr:hypothetical protein [Cyanobacteriota bacterium]
MQKTQFSLVILSLFSPRPRVPASPRLRVLLTSPKLFSPNRPIVVG